MIKHLNKNAPATNSVRMLAVALAAAALLAAHSAQGATLSKANDTDTLNLTTSWNGGVVPGVADIAQWDSTVTAANSVVLGANASWRGIKIVSPGGLVTIGAGNTLTLGASGIDMSAATQSLTLQSGVALGAGTQAWNVPTGQALNLNTGTFSRVTGAALTVVAPSGTSLVTSTMTGLSSNVNGIVGPWAVVQNTGNTTAANDGVGGFTYATISGGVISAYTGATPEAIATGSTWGGIPAGGTGLINYDISGTTGTAAGSLRNVNTIRYTGAGMTQAAGSTLTINGFMNAGTGPLSDAQNTAIGATNELVLAAASAAITMSGVIQGTGSVTVTGSSTVTLSGTNTYSGATNISGGTLIIGSSANLGNASATNTLTIGGGTLRNTASFDLTSNRALAIGSGGATFDVTGATALTLSGAVSGISGLTKIDTGTLILSGANSYSGTTTLSAGALNINSSTALGTGPFTISAGTFDNSSAAAIILSNNNAQNWNGDFTFTGSKSLNMGTGAVTLNSNRIVTVGASNLTVGGAIGGAFALTKTGVQHADSLRQQHLQRRDDVIIRHAGVGRRRRARRHVRRADHCRRFARQRGGQPGSRQQQCAELEYRLHLRWNQQLLNLGA